MKSKKITRQVKSLKPRTSASCVPASDVVSRTNPDGSVSLLSLRDSTRMFVIDGVAAQFWLSLDGKTTVDSWVAKILKRDRRARALGEKKVKTEAQKLLRKLKALKLVQSGEEI